MNEKLKAKLTAWLESRTTEDWTTMFRQALGFAFGGWVISQIVPVFSWLAEFTILLPQLIPNLQPDTFAWFILVSTALFVWTFMIVMNAVMNICFPDKYVVECKGCHK